MRIAYVWNQYEPPDRDTARRMAFASLTWMQEERAYAPEVMLIPIPTVQFARTGKSVNARAVPFVRDLFGAACNTTTAGETIVYLNADIALPLGTSLVIGEAMERVPCLYSHRVDVDHWDILSLDDLEAATSYIGADLFAFKREWWIEHREAFPDLLIGYEGWDHILKCMMRGSGFDPSRMPCVCYHKKHHAFWKDHVLDDPGQVYNRELCRAWAIENGHEADLDVNKPYLF